MKLAHIADPHLGIRLYHRQTPAGINQREADVAAAFRSAIDGVIAARPDVVVVAGDLFHSVRPTNAAIVFAFRQFQRLREALPNAPVIVIAGNHDTPRSAETGTILRLFSDIGVDVASEDARRFSYPELGLSVFAVPHQALAGGERPALRPDGPERHQVLVIHGEVEGVFPADRSSVEYGGVLLSESEITRENWSYVAFGHYHVRHQIGPRAWYAGALDYVSSNLWGELRDEAERGVRGKGWLLVDLDTGAVEPQPVAASRRIVDLPAISAAGLAAPAIDALIMERIRAVEGGIADQVVRLVVSGVPRHVARELDHTMLRALKAEALHFHLDVRAPDSQRLIGIGSPGRRQTLPEVVRDFLERRPLPSDVDRSRFVALGSELVDTVERDLTG